MKKSFLLLAVICMLGTAGFAQIHLGVKAGANLVKIDGKSFKEGFNAGYNLGGYLDLGFSPKWSIQPEVLWNQSETKLSEEFKDIYPDGIDELKDVKLNYLSIPILLSYKPSKLVTLQAGPQFGILLNKDQDLFENGKKAFKEGDLSILAGVQLNLGNTLKLGGRYGIGLNNLNDIDDRDEWKSQSFQIYVGFNLF